MAAIDPHPPRQLGATEWLICIIASIGFAFDIYELLIMPPVLRPALESLLDTEFGSPLYKSWAQWLFFGPAIVGGLLGLVGGYLTDIFGRRRVLTYSILLYAVSAVGAGLSTSAEMLLFFRCTTFAGVCIEFVAAIAWLAELFPNARQRETVLGVTQAFSSVGGLLVTGTLFFLKSYADQLPPIHGGNEIWRYAFISGVIPAIPLILIRPFLPESPAWRAKKEAGTLRRPSFAELFQPALLRTTIVTTLMFACSYGAAFGAIQQIGQIIPSMPEVAGLKPPERIERVATVQLWQELGGLTGRIILAAIVLYFASRQRLIRTFLFPGMIVVPFVFLYCATTSVQLLSIGIFVVGLLTVAQFSFWGNYLPLAYPIHLRGTGESFAANVGGRILGTSAAFVTIGISSSMPVEKSAQLATAAAVVGTTVFVLGFLLSFFLPEPARTDTHE